MLQTFEAVLKPNGSLQFLEPAPHQASAPCRVLVTFTEQPVSPAIQADDWKQLAGSLKNSPNLNGDPLVIQREMRHEWD
jgi:hypothetical protein